jgi:hypothetical protein
MSERIVQTTWTDGGPHQPLPPPEDTQGDEIERLTARIAELEAKLELCVRMAASWSPGSTIADVRTAIEQAWSSTTPAIGERREGGQ